MTPGAVNPGGVAGVGLERAALELGMRASAPFALVPPQRLESLDGARLGRRAGSSLEFRDFREYLPGDDLRHLDWSVYARSDQLVVRLYREEVYPHLEVLIDGSRSMAALAAKVDATLALAAFFATAAMAGGFGYGAWMAGARWRRLASAPAQPAAWPLPNFGHRGGLADALGHAPAGWHRRGVRLLISDLLVSEEPRRVLATLGHGAAAVVVVQVVSAEELEPTLRGFTRLQDAESGERLDLLVDGEAVGRYREALDDHRAAWRRACEASGATFVPVVAEPLLAEWQDGRRGPGFEPLAQLLRRGLLDVRGGGR